jgi:hypothetical protein
MTIPALDRLIQRLQTLETKFDELMLSLMAGQIPVKLTKAASVPSAKIEAPIPQLKLSQSKFVEIYNEIPILLQAYAIPVDWTIESYQNPKRPPLILEPRNNSNYWVVSVLVSNQILYWLVPNPLRQIQFDKLDHLSYLFDYYQLSQANKNSEFYLIKPGQVTYYFDSGVPKWKLEHQGEIMVANGSSAKSDPVQQIEALQQQVRQQEVTLQQLQQQITQLMNTRDISFASQTNDSEVTNAELIASWRTPQLTNSLKSQQGVIKSIAVTRWQGQQNKQILFASTQSGVIEVWDLESGKFVYDVMRSEELLSDTPSIAFDHQKQILIATSENHQIKARHISEKKEHIYGQHDEWILSLVLSKDSSYLATGDRQGIIKIWSTEQKSQIQEFNRDVPIVCMTITPDNQYLIAVDANQQLLFWQIQTAQLETAIKLVDLAWVIAISPDGKYLSLGFRNGDVQIWDAQTRTFRNQLTRMHQQIWSLAFDPRSQILASGGAGVSFCCWDVLTGNLISQPTSKQTSVSTIAFSENGKMIVTAGSDGIIDLWNSQ